MRAGEPIELEILGEDRTVPVASLVASDDREVLEWSLVRHGSVAVLDGCRPRTIVAEPIDSPRAVAGRHPAFLYVEGIYRSSIDRPRSVDAVDTRIVHAMARAGFVTMRVDKPGLGDSEGADCSSIDFSTELTGFEASLRQLAAMPSVDPDRIDIFGHSIGAVPAIRAIHDFVCVREDHERIAAIVDRRSPGTGRFLELDRAGHAFTRHESIQAAMSAMGQGEFAEDLPGIFIEWIEALEAG